jgi:Txe/YoeB family toxin of Txe-Axe toxin-antitoxin module
MKQFFIVVGCVLILLLSGGCVEKNKEQSRDDVDFTVCTEEQLPQEVQKMIEEKKEKPFQFIYSLQEYMYIVVGYGKQNGGGYSIRVDECSENQQNIFVDTTLIGSDEPAQDVNSYPYIVLKCVKSKKNVIFFS